MAGKKPEYELVVSEPFQGRAKGDIISDPAEVEAILKSESAGHVVKRAKDAPPPGAEKH